MISVVAHTTMAENSKVAGKVLVAMKGHPGTGKSTLSSAIAAALKIPLLEKYQIRAPFFSLGQPGVVDAMAYDAVFRIAAAQLRLGLSVVVDSTLERRGRLDELLRIASSAGAGVVVVECRPSDVAEWRRRLETRGRSEQASSHKPSTWQDLERMLEKYGGCTEYDVGDVPRIVVDTTGSAGTEELVSTVVDFIVSNCAPSPSSA